MLPQKTFQNKEILNIIEGLQQRQLIHWSDKKIIKAKIDAKGIGSRREYTYANLLEIGLANKLYQFGHATHFIREVIKIFNKSGCLEKLINESYPPKFYLIYRNKNIIQGDIVYDDLYLPRLPDDKNLNIIKSIIIIDLRKIKEDIDLKISEQVNNEKY